MTHGVEWTVGKKLLLRTLVVVGLLACCLPLLGGSAYGLDYGVRLTLDNPSPDSGDSFGQSLAVVGDKVLVGAPYDSTMGMSAGVAYLFDGTTGALLRTFYSPTPTANGLFGFSVAAVNGKLLIGAPYDAPLGQPYGAAYLFDATTGLLLRTFADNNTLSLGGFGTQVAAVGGNILVNSPTGETVFLYDGTTGALIHQFSMGSAAFIRPRHRRLGQQRPPRELECRLSLQPAELESGANLHRHRQWRDQRLGSHRHPTLHRQRRE